MSQLAPNILHIGIEATSQAWMYALVFMPDLEELVIQCARPSSLGAKVFQSLVVMPAYWNNLGATFPPGQLDTPLCPSLQRFGLKYNRWLRQSERFDMIPVFMSIIRSRDHFGHALKSFSLQMRHGQKDVLELVAGVGVAVDGFMSLANEINGIEKAALQFTSHELVLSSYTARSHPAFHRLTMPAK